MIPGSTVKATAKWIVTVARKLGIAFFPRKEARVAALSRYADGHEVNLWVTGNDGKVYGTSYHNSTHSWDPWSQVPGSVPGNIPAGSPITALSRYADGHEVNLWVTGNDGNVYSTSYHNSTRSWDPWSQVANPIPSSIPAGAPVTALSRYADGRQIDLWVTGNNGRVYSTSYQDSAQKWVPWSQISSSVPGNIPAGVPVTALSRYADGHQIDLWVTGNDGNVYWTFYQDSAQKWVPWSQLTDTITVNTQLGAPVTALSRYADGHQINVWVTGNDGNVYSTFFDDKTGAWADWFKVGDSLPTYHREDRNEDL